jgi:hypothetical protein
MNVVFRWTAGGYIVMRLESLETEYEPTNITAEYEYRSNMQTGLRDSTERKRVIVSKHRRYVTNVS